MYGHPYQPSLDPKVSFDMLLSLAPDTPTHKAKTVYRCSFLSYRAQTMQTPDFLLSTCCIFVTWPWNHQWRYIITWLISGSKLCNRWIQICSKLNIIMDLSLADSGCSHISTTAGEHHFPAFLSRVSWLKHFFVAHRNFCRPFLGRNLGSRVCKALRFRAVGVSQLNVVRHQTSAPPRPNNSDTKTIVAMAR
jgi:hypothetical protein